MNRPSCYGMTSQQSPDYRARACLNCPYILDCVVHEEFIGAQRRPAADEPQKADKGKPMPELLPFRALDEVSAVLAYGATKYAPHNWRKGVAWSRMLGAALRHLSAWGAGESSDPETGRSHLAHAAACALFLLEYEVSGEYRAHDDRWKGGGGHT